MSVVRRRAQRLVQRRPERRRRGHPHVLAAEERRGVGEVEAVGRGHVLLERRALARDGQELEDPAAVVVEQHDRRAGPRAAGRPAARRGRAPARRRRAAAPPGRAPRPPRRRRSRPCRRCRSRRGWPARAAASRAPGRTSPRRAPASRTRRRAWPRAAAARPARPRPAARTALAGAIAAAMPRAAAAVGARPGGQPGTVARAAPEPPGERAQRGGRIGGSDRADGARRVLPRVLGVERDLQRRSPSPCSQLAQRLRGREIADAEHELGPVRLRPVRIAQQRVVVRDRRRPAAGAGQRVGEQRDPRPLGERGERGAEPRVALLAARDDDRPRPRGQLAPSPSTSAGAGCGRAPRPGDPRPPAGAAAAARLVLRQRRDEHERLAQREVQVHRPGPALERGPVRAAARAGAASACAPAWPGAPSTSRNHFAALP